MAAKAGEIGCCFRARSVGEASTAAVSRDGRCCCYLTTEDTAAQRKMLGWPYGGHKYLAAMEACLQRFISGGRKKMFVVFFL